MYFTKNRIYSYDVNKVLYYDKFIKYAMACDLKSVNETENN